MPTITPFSRISLSIAGTLLLGASVDLTVFGFAVLREDATDLSHMMGAAFNFIPDTRWFGFAVITAIGSAYFFAKALNKSFGRILVIITVLWGLALVLVPELITN